MAKIVIRPYQNITVCEPTDKFLEWLELNKEKEKLLAVMDYELYKQISNVMFNPKLINEKHNLLNKATMLENGLSRIN